MGRGRAALLAVACFLGVVAMAWATAGGPVRMPDLSFGGGPAPQVPVASPTTTSRLWLQRAGLLWLVALLAWGARRVADASAVDTVLGLVLVAGVCWWAAVRNGRTRPLGGA